MVGSRIGCVVSFYTFILLTSFLCETRKEIVRKTEATIMSEIANAGTIQIRALEALEYISFMRVYPFEITSNS